MCLFCFVCYLICVFCMLIYTLSLCRDELLLQREQMKLAKVRFDVKLDVGKGVVAQTKHIVDSYVVQPILLPIKTAVERKYVSNRKKMRRSVRQAVEVATIRARKVYLKFNGHFDEVQRELKYEIFRQYVDHHVQLAKDKARREFNVIEQGALTIQLVMFFFEFSF